MCDHETTAKETPGDAAPIIVTNADLCGLLEWHAQSSCADGQVKLELYRLGEDGSDWCGKWFAGLIARSPGDGVGLLTINGRLLAIVPNGEKYEINSRYLAASAALMPLVADCLLRHRQLFLETVAGAMAQDGPVVPEGGEND